jgi:hypothetical protein
MSETKSNVGERLAKLRAEHDLAVTNRNRKGARHAFQAVESIAITAIQHEESAIEAKERALAEKAKIQAALGSASTTLDQREALLFRARRVRDAADLFLFELRSPHRPETAARLALELHDRIEEFQLAEKVTGTQGVPAAAVSTLVSAARDLASIAS